MTTKKQCKDRRKFNRGTGRKRTPPTPVFLDLSTLSKTRESFARIIAAYNQGIMKETRFTRLCYGLGGLLGYWKAERDEDFLKRLEKLEQLFQEGSHAGNRAS